MSSDSLGFCLHFLLQCLCQLCKLSGNCHSIFLKIFLFSLFSYHYWSLFQFQLLLITRFSSGLPSLHSYLPKIFISSIFASFARLIHCLCQLWLQHIFKLSFLSIRCGIGGGYFPSLSFCFDLVGA